MHHYRTRKHRLQIPLGQRWEPSDHACSWKVNLSHYPQSPENLPMSLKKIFAYPNCRNSNHSKLVKAFSFAQNMVQKVRISVSLHNQYTRLSPVLVHYDPEWIKHTKISNSVTIYLPLWPLLTDNFPLRTSSSREAKASRTGNWANDFPALASGLEALIFSA